MPEEKNVASKIGWWIMNGFCWLGIFSGIGALFGVLSSGNEEISRGSEVVLGLLLIGACGFFLKSTVDRKED